jgi:hypothetical protein
VARSNTNRNSQASLALTWLSLLALSQEALAEYKNHKGYTDFQGPARVDRD